MDCGEKWLTIKCIIGNGCDGIDLSVIFHRLWYNSLFGVYIAICSSNGGGRCNQVFHFVMTDVLIAAFALVTCSDCNEDIMGQMLYLVGLQILIHTFKLNRLSVDIDAINEVLWIALYLYLQIVTIKEF